MNFVYNLFSENLINATGWTLFHSIWQIGVVAVFLKLVLLLLKKKSSDLRYSLSAISLFVIIICSSVTFSKHYLDESINQETSDNVLISNFNIQNTPGQSGDFLYNKKGNTTPALNYKFFNIINSNLNLIVGLWLLGITFFFLRFAGSYWYIQRLRTFNNFPVNKKWQSIVIRISQKFKIKQRIKVAESAIVKIPIVIGYFKPIILLPVGLVSSLPYDQVEAVITHELAHIKRKDYLINIIKSLMEAVFFYHPAFWWISSVMNTERENCCDDMTIKASGNTESLRNALINLYEYNQESIKIAAALFKNNYQLLKRVKRMKTTNQTNHGIKGIMAGLVILLAGLIIITTNSAFSPRPSDLPVENQTFVINSEIFSDVKPGLLFLNPAEKEANKDKVPVVEKMIQQPDTTKSKKKESEHRVVKRTDEGTWRLVVDKKGKIIEATVDGKKFSEKELEKISIEVENDVDIELEIKMDSVKVIIREAEKKMKKALQEYDKAMEAYVKVMEKHNDLSAIKLLEIAEGDYAKALALTEIAMDRNHIFIDRINEDIYKNLIDLDEKLLELEFEFSDKHIDLIKDLEIDMEFENLEELEVLENLELELEDINENLIKTYDIFESVIRSELIEDKIIKKRENLSFRLTAKKLVVNGKKQPKDIHEKYLKLYEDIIEEELEGTTQIIIED
ncbi:MAG: M56 family metallopeptidase [Bacteroidetes bacterium]|nr:M56 family metallopeptidase [Bacteroidota bacterium]MBL7104522.1 M56 family metallopeptidase [Bacteroidales bacterium]